MADLDALLGIEEEKEEAPQVIELAGGPPTAAAVAVYSAAPDIASHALQPSTKPDSKSTNITIDASVLRQLAEAEAARAEQLGSSAASGEMQARMADSIERIVEQVGAGIGGCMWQRRRTPCIHDATPGMRHLSSAEALLRGKCQKPANGWHEQSSRVGATGGEGGSGTRPAGRRLCWQATPAHDVGQSAAAHSNARQRSLQHLQQYAQHCNLSSNATLAGSNTMLYCSSMHCPLVQAKKLAEEKEAGDKGGDKSGGTLADQAVRQELANLYSALAGTRGVDPEDLK
jgi:hypothetical protein